jgi:tetratricopeptide (TPR) repeat protein
MAQHTPVTRQTRLGSWWAGIASRMLLIPEAVAIMVLLAVGVVFPGIRLIGVAVALLTCWMALRIGLLYLTQKLLEQEYLGAAEHCSRLVALMHPWSADAWALRGVIALSVGEFEDAANYLRRSLDLFSTSAATQVALSGALLMVGKPASARMAAQHALMLDPKRAIAFLYIAEAEQIEGHSVLAIEDTLRQGLAIAERADDQAAIRCTLSGLLLSQGRNAEAGLLLGGVEAFITRCAPAAKRRLRLRYGELLIAQGQIERAREYLQQSQLTIGGRQIQNEAWEGR